MPVLTRPLPTARRTALLAASLAASLVVSAGCATAIRSSAAPAVRAPIGIAALRHTDADVHFMSGMIHHHAQAVLIAEWAPARGAGSDLQRLCERIVVGQSDEIVLMQNWLKDKGAPVPEATPGAMKMRMDGMEHEMLMPGMLTESDLKQLEGSRGGDFDRLFLTFMIRHHEGALEMVDKLFASPGAAQDETVFRFASDVFADQTTEIRVMEEMLEARGAKGGAPPRPDR